MQITSLHLKNFRCFSHTVIAFEKPIVLIEGANGSGKTSLLEALHYLCYLRSFRLHSPRDLVNKGRDGFFVKACFSTSHDGSELAHEIQVGFAGKKRVVKVDHRTISSFKELIAYYRIITLTEDDLDLIKGGPDVRRSFIDHFLLLSELEFATIVRSFRQILENRNMLLQNGSYAYDSYLVWTKQLWEKSRSIQILRKKILKTLEQRINVLVNQYLKTNQPILLNYKTKKNEAESFDDFLALNKSLYCEEQRYGRSLFGAHLDDFTISFQNETSKMFASRGQQKMIILLIKMAQIQELFVKKEAAVFLLDDFLTDFDYCKAKTLLDALSLLGCQLIFTSPVDHGFLKEVLSEQGCQIISLTN